MKPTFMRCRAIKSQAQLIGGLAFLCTAALALCAQSQTGQNAPAPQQELPALIRSTNGSDLFHAYCATCHGVDAKGNGPAAAALKTKPPNLTVLSKNNRGVFPADRVRKTITGDDVVAAHGSREMPIWGPIFHQIEEDVDRGHVRVENLVKYLESIQTLK